MSYFFINPHGNFQFIRRLVVETFCVCLILHLWSNFWSFIFLIVYVCTRMSQHVCGGSRTTCGSSFFHCVDSRDRVLLVLAASTLTPWTIYAPTPKEDKLRYHVTQPGLQPPLPLWKVRVGPGTRISNGLLVTLMALDWTNCSQWKKCHWSETTPDPSVHLPLTVWVVG